MQRLKMQFEETGEVRCPRTGEWFMGTHGPDQARFDFECQRLPILRLVFEEAKEVNDAEA